MSLARERHTKREAEVRTSHASFDEALEEGELLTGTPTLTVSPAGTLTADTPALTTGDVDISGRSVAAARALSFRISGGTEGVSYIVTVTAASDGSPAQTIELDCPVSVVPRAEAG